MTTAARSSDVQYSSASPQGGKVLLLVALERVVRAVVLISVGLLLLTHSHSNLQQGLLDLAHSAGLDPSRNGIARLLNKTGTLTARKLQRDGAVALGYGLLEAAESYGLLRHRRWGEYLTVVSTVLLFIPEIDELTRKPTALKVLALVINVLVVAYLLVRLTRTRARTA